MSEAKKPTEAGQHEHTPDAGRVLTPEEESVVTAFEHEASVVPQMIGRDFRMQVKRGKPGGGDHWNFVRNEIHIDPLHVIEKGPEYALGVLAHEGSHRRVSYPPNKLIRDDIWQETGFSHVFNAIEDPRVNNWVAACGLGLRDWIRAYMSRDVAPGGDLDYRVAAQKKLGWVPKFSQYGSEVIGFWFRRWEEEHAKLGPIREQFRRGEIPLEAFAGAEKECVETQLTLAQYFERHAPDVDARVRETLEKTWPAVQASIDEAPPLEPSDTEVRASASKSYLTRFEKVWPEVKKLVDEDKKDSAASSMVSDNAGELMSGAPSKDNPLAGLSPEEQKELRDAIVKQFEGKSKEELEALFEQAAKENGAAIPIPLDALSAETRKKLREIVAGLPPAKRNDLEVRGEQSLRDIEDALNMPLRPHGVPKIAETHTEFAARKDAGEHAMKAAEERATEERDRAVAIERARETMAKEEAEKRSPYERVQRELQSLIDEKVRAWQAIFSPTRNPRFISGFPSGVRLDMRSGKLMQWEANKAKGIPSAPDFFEQKTIPVRRDYTFEFLVDLSGSMKKGRKIEETFKAVVFLTEVFNKIGLDFEVLGFHTLPKGDKQRAAFVFKDRVQNLLNVGIKETVKKKIDTMLTEVRSKGAGDNDDGPAVQWAAERLAKKQSRNKFLIVFSDGEPDPSNIYEEEKNDLAAQVAAVKRTHKVNPVCVKLGSGSGDPSLYYEEYLLLDDVAKLALALDALLRSMVQNPLAFRVQ